VLKITKEPRAWIRDPAERCAMCKRPTRYWHTPTNTPVCPSCAASATTKDLPEPVNT